MYIVVIDLLVELGQPEPHILVKTVLFCTKRRRAILLIRPSHHPDVVLEFIYILPKSRQLGIYIFANSTQ